MNNLNPVNHSTSSIIPERVGMVKSLISNSTVLLVSRFATKIIGVFSVMLLARHLGSENFGVLSYALSFCALFGVLADIGLDTYAVREISKNIINKDNFVGSILVIKLFLSAFMIIAIYTVSVIINMSVLIKEVVFIIGVSFVFTRMVDYFYAVFQAHEKMIYQAVGQIILSLAMLVGIIMGVLFNCSIYWYSIVYCISNFIALVYVVYICYSKYVKILFVYDLKYYKKIVLNAIPFGISAVFIVIYYNTDTIMISHLVDNTATGNFNAAMRIFLSLMMIPSVYNISLFPIVSRSYKVNKDDFNAIVSNSVRIMLLASVPIAFILTVYSDEVIFLLYGKEYDSAGNVLEIIIWSFVLASIGGVFGYVMNATGRQKQLAIATGIGATTNVILNIFLIPYFGIIGASVATVISRIFVIIYEIIIINKYSIFEHFKENTRTLIKISVSIAVMYVIMHIIGRYHVVINIIMSSILYIVMLCITKEVSIRELFYFIKLIMPNKKRILDSHCC